MTESDKIEILGIDFCTSTGLRNGVVVDIEKTVQSIRTAIERAELMAGRKDWRGSMLGLPWQAYFKYKTALAWLQLKG